MGFLLWLSLIVSIHTLIGKRAVYCVIFQGQTFFAPKCFSPHEAQISSSLDSSTCDHCCCGLEIERPKKKKKKPRLLRTLSHTLVLDLCESQGLVCLLRGKLPRAGVQKAFLSPFAYLLFVDSPLIWLFEKTPFSFTSLLRMTRTRAVGIHLDRIKTERKEVYKNFFYTCLHQHLSGTLSGIFHPARGMFFTSILKTACGRHLKQKGPFK